MKLWSRSGAILFSSCLWASAALAQPAVNDGKVVQNFEGGQTSWLPFGEGVGIGVTRDAEHVKSGNAALQFNYQIQKGQLQAMLMPVNQGRLARLQSIQFWVKAGQATSLAMLLQEGENGGRYLALFAAPEQQWQKVELTPDDFSLMQDKDSPKDTNGQLDLDQVQFVALGDFAQFLANAEGPMAQLFQVREGPRTLYLDDLELSSEPLPNLPAEPADAVSIDYFAHPQLNWLAVGSVFLERRENTPANQDRPIPGLQFDYRRTKGQLSGLMRWVKNRSLQGTKGLAMEISSERAVTLAVQLEEVGGGKYFSLLELPAGGEIHPVTLPYAQFNASNDSRDENGRLDLEQVQQLLILDTAAFTGEGEGDDNVVWLSNLRATK
jgi:hypothetical protein